MKKLSLFKVLTVAAATVILTGCAKSENDGTGTFTDSRDGQVYKIVKIGNQIWMAQNFNYNAEGSRCYGEGGIVGRTDKGMPFPDTLSEEQIRENCEKYGRLYDWETAKKAAPQGWRLPTDKEWKKLLNAAGGSKTAGEKLKSNWGWNYDNNKGKSGSGTDTYGFSALPGGYAMPYLLVDLSDCLSKDAGFSGYWWGATKDGYAYRRYISWNNDDVGGAYDGFSNRRQLFSVRYVCDDTTGLNLVLVKEKKEKQPKQEEQEEYFEHAEEYYEEYAEEEAEPAAFEFDWGKMSELKNSTIEKLKEKAKPEDEIIKEFFEKYGELIGEVSNALFSAYGSDWEFDEKMSEGADEKLTNFLKDMKNYGMDLEQVEGSYYIEQNNDFIKKVLLPHVNSVSAQYINISCDQRDERGGSPFYDESASYTIDMIYRCGELLEKADGLFYKEELEESVKNYVGFLFSQHSETFPVAWQWQEQDVEAGTPRYMYFPEEAAEQMNEIVKEHPSSRAAKEFKPYLAALKKMNYRDAAGDGEGGKFYDYVAVENGEKLLDARDGQFYKIVKIGEQVWMGENLNYAAEGSKCYDNNPENCAKYGRLYDWGTAKKAAPQGWHLSTDEEWDTLINYAGVRKNAGGKLKSKSGWDGAFYSTDEYGFSALPGGFLYSDFLRIDEYGLWWGSNRTYRMYKDGNDIIINIETSGSSFYSVRCVKDK